MKNKSEKTKQRPVHEIKLPFHGTILKAAIWRHESERTGPNFSVSFTRSHREAKDGKWVSTGYFRRDDLLGLSSVAEAAHGYIVNNCNSGGTNK